MNARGRNEVSDIACKTKGYDRNFSQRAFIISCISLLIVFFSIPAEQLLAQTARADETVNNETAVPTPGVGHDYIHMLSETVDPKGGSLSLRIEAPPPMRTAVPSAPYAVYSPLIRSLRDESYRLHVRPITVRTHSSLCVQLITLRRVSKLVVRPK